MSVPMTSPRSRTGRRPRRVLGAVTAALALGATAFAGPVLAAPGSPAREQENQVSSARGVDPDVRVATFNTSLNRNAAGELLADLSTPDDEQAQNVAEIVQRTRPDVLLVNELDYVEGGAAVDLFRDHYLTVGQNGARPVDYPYVYVAPVNTGVPTGLDLNGDGITDGPDDAFGFGLFPGQYGMAVLSRYPIDADGVRTFQNFRWRDMPGNLMPTDYYSPEAQEILRLSSKSHWDVPIRVGTRTVHLLASHPTPPSFDGPEDRNGRRNHDEIRFWADYTAPRPSTSQYIYDDEGGRGGLRAGTAFVVAGDQNADPYDGDSYDGAIWQLLDHPLIRPRTTPGSAGGTEASALQGGVNAEHEGDPRYDTADFSEPPGNLRVDYVLPSRGLPVRSSGVFWPTSDDPLSRLTGTFPFPSSDHRLVWVDVLLPHRAQR